MSELIFEGDHAEDRTYRALLRPEWRSLKDNVEAMWVDYEPFADPGFSRNLGRSFADCFWEMYLACSLHRAGWKLRAKDDSAGPDVRARFGDTNVWVEAIAVTRGEDGHPDQLPEPPKKGAWCYSPEFEGKMILRLTSAIHTKWQQRERHIESGYIEAEDPYVIAINTCQIDSFLVPTDLPYVVRAVFPIGREHLEYRLGADGRLREMHRLRSYTPELSRAAGRGAVPTTIFLGPPTLREFEGLSAVVHSHASVGNVPEPLGVDFCWVLNPKARNELPEPADPVGTVWEATLQGDHWNLRRRGAESDEVVEVRPMRDE